MSRVHHLSVWRPLAVWVAVSIATAGGTATVPGAWHAAARHADFATLLVAACATALAAALAWLWAVATLTVAGFLTGRDAHWRAGATRRLVLAACGAAVVVGPALPALAAGGEGAQVLTGLALPERATAPTAAARRPGAPSQPYVVRSGDSLWSIARAHPAAGTTVDARWRAIWRANRAVVGDDPDLILPGQALRLPADPIPPTDGDR